MCPSDLIHTLNTIHYYPILSLLISHFPPQDTSLLNLDIHNILFVYACLILIILLVLFDSKINSKIRRHCIVPDLVRVILVSAWMIGVIELFKINFHSTQVLIVIIHSHTSRIDKLKPWYTYIKLRLKVLKLKTLFVEPNQVVKICRVFCSFLKL